MLNRVDFGVQGDIHYGPQFMTCALPQPATKTALLSGSL